MISSRCIFITLFIITLVNLSCIPIANAGLFGGGKKKEEEKKAKEAMQDSVYAGMEQMKHVMNDKDALLEAAEMMKDPETMAEVQRMMNDPNFIKEMERIKQDPMFANAMRSAQDMYQDPEKASKVFSQMLEQKAELSDAELGIRELAKTARDPKMMAEAMEMLKDPEMQAEVQQMMKDPQFQKDMKKMTESSQFKEAMGRAKDDIEVLSKDPALMAKLKAQAAQMEL